MTNTLLMTALRAITTSQTRDAAVPTYRHLLRHQDDYTVEDIKVINQAIIARWSVAGLRYIKEQAWKAPTP